MTRKLNEYLHIFILFAIRVDKNKIKRLEITNALSPEVLIIFSIDKIE